MATAQGRSRALGRATRAGAQCGHGTAPSFGSFVGDLTDAIAAWEEQYVSEASYAQYRRASAWVVDESVKNVTMDMRAPPSPNSVIRPYRWSTAGSTGAH